MERVIKQIQWLAAASAERKKKVLFISIEKYHTKQRARHPKKKLSPEKPEKKTKLSYRKFLDL